MRRATWAGPVRPAVNTVLAALLLAAWSLPSEVVAQATGSVVVRVTDAASGDPLPESAVMVEGSSLGALTDREGRALLQGMQPGTHRVIVERLGYATASHAVEVAAGGTSAVDFALESRAISMPAVVVTATREARRLSEIAAAVGVVGRREIAQTHAAHPSEIMSKVPGVWVNVTGGEGHMTAIRQPLTTDPVYLYLEDGVPTRSTGFFNHNALYEINLPQAERIEVMKGPANALYGSDAIGGVINAQTRAPSEELEHELSVEGGGHGFGRLLGTLSTGTPGGGVRADLNYTRSEGWREGTAYDRWSGTLRWDLRTAGDYALKTVAAFSTIDQSTAGSSVLSRDDFRSAPTVNYTPISWRSVGALRVSTEIERRMGGTSLVVTPYMRSNSMDLLPNWSLTYDPAIWETRNLSFGVLAKVRRELPSLGGQVIVGVDVDYAPGSHSERQIQPVRTNGIFTSYTEGDPLYDYDVTFKQAAPYLHAELSPVDRLRLSAGVRADLIGYGYENRLSVVQTGRHRRPADASPSYSALSPKLGATFELAQDASVFASYRRGFRVPSEGQLFRQGSAENTLDLEPVRSDNFDVGLRGLLGSRVRYDVTVYHMRMFDEILGFQLPDGSSENVNAGETLHRGVEIGAGVALPAGIQADLALTFAEHRYESWSPSEGVEFSGNEQESAPNLIAHGQLAWTPEAFPDSRLAFTWDRLGPYWMDQANEHEYEGHHLLGLRASHRLHERLSAFVNVTNLADVRYAERASFNAFRGEELAPGLPRTLYLGVEIR